VRRDPRQETAAEAAEVLARGALGVGRTTGRSALDDHPSTDLPSILKIIFI
jgi:hypothetical protein